MPQRRLAWSILTPLLLIAQNPAAKAQTAPRPFDLVIEHGHIIDGTGSPWYSGDIGIRAGRIAAIGRLDDAAADRRIDAHGMVVAPGFIDMLGQSDLTILVEPRLPSKIFQGITTEITGEGGSVAPLNDSIIHADSVYYAHLGIIPDWRDLDGYFARLQQRGMGINLATYVGATQIRRMVLGDSDVTPTPAQLDSMKGLVRSAMEQGAVGVSTALQYAPAPYASTSELIALAGEAGKYGGIYATHMRSEGDAEMAALDEAIRIGREGHLPVEIWHLKAAGKNNWGKMPAVVAKIDSARGSGVDISANTYAYTAWFNSMSAFVPPWAHDGGDAALLKRLQNPADRARIRRDMLSTKGDWDNEWQEIPGPEAVLVSTVQNPALLPLQGKTLAQIAQLQHKDPIDALLDLLIADKAYTGVAVFAMSEPDVELALKQPWTSVDNDSQGTSPDGPLGREHPHPRAYGTFPRIIRKFVREEHLLTLPEAIRKFSALPAQRMRLTDRGVLKEGMWADIVVFDPDSVRDLATFEHPNQLAVGMQYVLVNGVPVIAGGRMTGALPGRPLRGPGYRAAAPGQNSASASTGDACCSPAELQARLAVAERYRVAGVNDRRISHDQFWEAVAPFTASPALRTETVGRSMLGRNVRSVTFGHGPTTVLLWSQMHGDESTATMALADIFAFLADSTPDPLRRRLDSALTIVFVPMLNPDGAEHWERENAAGIDINRDAAALATPEARILKGLRDRLHPAWGFNLHDQSARMRAGRDGRETAIALLPPATDSTGGYNATRARARLLAAGIATALGGELPGRIARYDESFNPRAFGDNMERWGTSTVLIESGALPGDPAKQRLRTLNAAAILVALDAIATGRYASADPDRYTSLPQNTGGAGDLLIMGGSLVLPDQPPIRADLEVNYDDPVARTGGRVRDVGDLSRATAMDTVNASGLFVIPDSAALTTDPNGKPWLRIGSPAALEIRRGSNRSSPLVSRIPAPAER